MRINVLPNLRLKPQIFHRMLTGATGSIEIDMLSIFFSFMLN